MRILYIDCDSLRPDHLGCYGYDRDTSPNIDRVADAGRRFTNYYAADAPCLPSRTGLFTARFGVHTGVVNHGGLNADIRPRGERRLFDSRDDYETWPMALREAGYRTALVSPFPSRHAAWHVLDGFRDWHDTGGNGREAADAVFPPTEQWLREHATEEDWYCHVNFWDPHTHYTTPLDFGDPFADDPAPEWLTEERIADQRERPGPFSARDLYFYGEKGEDFPEAADERMPDEIASREDFGRFVDGYDAGIRYMDEYVGRLFDALESAGVFGDTLVIVSADHGENLGELNVYGDHVTADEWTCNVPLVVRGPGIEPGVDDDFHYQIDFGPTLCDLAGVDAQSGWDGRSFAASVTDDASVGREALVFEHAAWTCQRSVRWADWLLIRTYHDAYMDFPPVMLFDVVEDPHETTDLAADRPEVVARGLALLDVWVDERLLETVTGSAGGNPDAPDSDADPLWQVLWEGGPFHPRGADGDRLSRYLDRLRETGREGHADRLERTRGFVEGTPARYLQ